MTQAANQDCVTTKIETTRRLVINKSTLLALLKNSGLDIPDTAVVSMSSEAVANLDKAEFTDEVGTVDFGDNELFVTFKVQTVDNVPMTPRTRSSRKTREIEQETGV